MLPMIRQLWVITCVVIFTIGQGFVFSYPYILLRDLQAPDSPIPVTLETGSWLTSSISIMMIFGLLGASCLMERFGRKLSCAIIQVPSIIGWLLIYMGRNITTVMIGRLATGLGTGSTLVIGSTIIGEYSIPTYRGLFLGIKTTALNVGITIFHVTSDYCDWRTAAIIGALPSLIVFLITFTLPESPLWLMTKKRFEEGEKSFYKLRGRSQEAIREFEAMLKAQKEIISNDRKQLTTSEYLGKLLQDFRRRNFVQPVLIILLSFTLLEVSGRHVFPAYAQDFIAKVKGNLDISSSSITIGIDIILVLSTIASCILIKIVRRRYLLFFSGISSCMVLAVTCLYVFLESNGSISNVTPWLPISMLVCYLILGNLGSTTIPLALFGEIFPLEHKGTGTFIGGVMTMIPMLLILQLTPVMLVSIEFYGTFFVFGLFLLLSLVILYYILPETKDKTLQEIEDEIKHKGVVNKVRKNTLNVVAISVISN